MTEKENWSLERKERQHGREGIVPFSQWFLSDRSNFICR